MTLLLSLLGVVGVYLLVSGASSASSANGSPLTNADGTPRDLDATPTFRSDLTTLLGKKDAPVDTTDTTGTTPPVDATPPPPPVDTTPPPPPAAAEPMHITLEPGKSSYDAAEMRFCAFEGDLTVHLPSGARWATPALEIYANSAGWTLDPWPMSIINGSKTDLYFGTTNAFFSFEASWIDAAGKPQKTSVQFTGPDKPGDTGSDASTFCALAHCASCDGKAPGTRVAGAAVSGHTRARVWLDRV